MKIEYTVQEMNERNELNKDLLKSNTETYILRSFYQASTSLEAKSWIEIAKCLAMNETAEIMDRHLNFELKFQ